MGSRAQMRQSTQEVRVHVANVRPCKLVTAGREGRRVLRGPQRPIPAPPAHKPGSPRTQAPRRSPSAHPPAAAPCTGWCGRSPGRSTRGPLQGVQAGGLQGSGQDWGWAASRQARPRGGGPPLQPGAPPEKTRSSATNTSHLLRAVTDGIASTLAPISSSAGRASRAAEPRGARGIHPRLTNSHPLGTWQSGLSQVAGWQCASASRIERCERGGSAAPFKGKPPFQTFQASVAGFVNHKKASHRARAMPEQPHQLQPWQHSRGVSPAGGWHWHGILLAAGPRGGSPPLVGRWP